VGFDAHRIPPAGARARMGEGLCLKHGASADRSE
jgi:hypothetical protein